MNIYHSVPSAEAMAARCKRDKIDPSELVEVVAPRGHYAIRCLGLPVSMQSWEPGSLAPVKRDVPGFLLYSLRRDGKICNGWGFARRASDMLEIAGVVKEHQ